ITGDAPANVNFFAGVLGLRLVKKTVNQDDPTVYHLFYADEKGSPGADLTFFEYPGARPGQAGDGMIHRIVWRVASGKALDFWRERLNAQGIEVAHHGDHLRFFDPEGLELELRAVDSEDEPLVADHPQVPKEMALQGFHEARAYSSRPQDSRQLFEETLGFESTADNAWSVRGARREGAFVFEPPPPQPGIPGAGTVHHIAWASPMDDHEEWRKALVAARARPTPVIDRFYFRSIYFREPSGVLFEIATLGPGFSADEDQATLGRRLSLPPRFEPLREQLEKTLTPLPDPRREVLQG
ncbi:MAG: VOC family protein, partial [Actinomycetota bacterium]